MIGLLGGDFGGQRPSTTVELAAVVPKQAKVVFVPGEAFGRPGTAGSPTPCRTRRWPRRWSAWRPAAPFAELVDHVAFYCALMDRCTVGGEVVVPQPCGFYGGWVTSWVVGPFKGAPGTLGW